MTQHTHPVPVAVETTPRGIRFTSNVGLEVNNADALAFVDATLSALLENAGHPQPYSIPEVLTLLSEASSGALMATALDIATRRANYSRLWDGLQAALLEIVNLRAQLAGGVLLPATPRVEIPADFVPMEDWQMRDWADSECRGHDHDSIGFGRGMTLHLLLNRAGVRRE